MKRGEEEEGKRSLASKVSHPYFTLISCKGYDKTILSTGISAVLRYVHLPLMVEIENKDLEKKNSVLLLGIGSSVLAAVEQQLSKWKY